jgi:prolyl-tRNA synthetase
VIGDHIQQAKKLATYIESLGGSVLLDDRDIGYGAKAADSDLWGIPTRIVVSEKTVSAGGYETKARTESTGELVVHMFE